VLLSSFHGEVLVERTHTGFVVWGLTLNAPPETEVNAPEQVGVDAVDTLAISSLTTGVLIAGVQPPTPVPQTTITSNRPNTIVLLSVLTIHLPII